MKVLCIRACIGLIGVLATACGTDDKRAAAADTTTTIVRDATTSDLRTYTLDMDKMRRYAAAAKALDDESKRNPSVVIDVNIGKEPISESIATVERNDFVTDLLKRAGTTPRDFVMTMGAYLQAATTSAALDANPNARIPEGQNADNVEFVRSRRVEIDKIMSDAGLGQ
ncbi:MAG TPA: hypothetical protein VES88_07535 [Gemmatimonadaceae bacterium]|nr:hypothetical protein [Gemmatimonadaceae bacterium]